MDNNTTFKVMNLKCLMVSGRREIRIKFVVSTSIVLEPSNSVWYILK